MVHDYQASAFRDYGSDISQPSGNTNSILWKLSNQIPRLNGKNDVEVGASSRTMPNSYSNAQKSDTKRQSSREHSPTKRNLKEQNIAVGSFETPCGTNELSLRTKDKNKKETLKKTLPQNKKQPDTYVLSSSITCTCNDGLNDKMSVIPISVIDAKEKYIGEELLNNRETQKDNLHAPSSISQILLTGNRNIPMSVKFSCCPNNTCEENCSKADDSGVPRCASPEFPPPSQEMLKNIARNYKHKREHLVQLLSNVKKEVMEMQITAENSPKAYPMSAPFESFNSSISVTGVRTIANEAGNVCVKNENYISQCCPSQSIYQHANQSAHNKNYNSYTENCAEEEIQSQGSKSVNTQRKSDKSSDENHKLK